MNIYTTRDTILKIFDIKRNNKVEKTILNKSTINKYITFVDWYKLKKFITI